MLLPSCNGNEKDSKGDTKAKSDERPFVPIRSVPAFVPIDFELLEADNPIQPNNEMVKSFFETLKNSDYLQSQIPDTSFAISQLNYPIIYGKLNADAAIDVLIPITFRKPNEADKSKKHPYLFENYYIVALNDGEKLRAAELFYSGNDEAELLIQFRSITDSGTIIGKQIPNTFNKYPDEFSIIYTLEKGELRAK